MSDNPYQPPANLTDDDADAEKAAACDKLENLNVSSYTYFYIMYTAVIFSIFTRCLKMLVDGQILEWAPRSAVMVGAASGILCSVDYVRACVLENKAGLNDLPNLSPSWRQRVTENTKSFNFVKIHTSVAAIVPTMGIQNYIRYSVNNDYAEKTAILGVSFFVGFLVMKWAQSELKKTGIYSVSMDDESIGR